MTQPETTAATAPCGKTFGPADHAVDYDASYRTLEDALAKTTVLNRTQKENLRIKAEDLRQRRLVWESVPFRVLFEFNRRCNVKCVHCDIPRAGTGDLSVEAFERLMDDIGWGVHEVMPLLGGEPTLVPIDEIAPIARRHNTWLNFITNGVLFDQAYFEPIADITSRVQFSLHGHRPDLFERVMPAADFHTVVRNLADAVAIGRQTGTHVVPCIVPMLDMLDHMEDYVRFVADLGVRRLIIQKLYPHTRKLQDLHFMKDRLPEEAADVWAGVLEVAKDSGVFIETNVAELFGDPANVPEPGPFDILQDNVHIVELFSPGFCCSTAIQSVIEWDGATMPCIRDRFLLGNLNENTFDEMWNGEVMRDLRQSLFDRQLWSRCKLCFDFYLGHP